MPSDQSHRFEIKAEPGVMDMAAVNSLVGLLQLPKLGSGPRNQAKAVCLLHGFTVEDYDKFYNNPQALVNLFMENESLKAMQIVHSGNREIHQVQHTTQLENEIHALKKKNEDQAKQVANLQKEMRSFEKIRNENKELRKHKREQDRKILNLKRSRARK